MSKKAIILCISVIAVLVLGVAVAVSILYSDVEHGADSKEERYMGDSRYGLFQAVPSDAVMIVDFASFRDVVKAFGETSILGGMAMESKPFETFVSRLASLTDLPMKSSRTVLSFHYSRNLSPLLVIDAGRSKDMPGDDVSELMELADSAGLFTRYLDGASVADKGSYLEKRSLLLISSSDVFLQSSERHVSQGISVLSLKGFYDVASKVTGNVRLFFANANADKLLHEVFNAPYAKYADFLKRVSDWVALSLDKSSDGSLTFSGCASYGPGMADYMNTLLSSSASVSGIPDILPSYTVFAASIPMDNAGAYVAAYEKYSDARIGLAKYMARHKELKSRAGISPKDWAEILKIKEVGTASFYIGQNLESLLFVKVGNADVQTIFKGTGVTTLKGYVPEVHPFMYSGFASSVFGGMFSLADESSFTYVNGWIVAGSKAGVGEFVNGRALENSLRKYLSDAGCSAPVEVKGLSLVSYASLTEDSRALEKVLRPSYSSSLAASVKDVVFAPVVMTVGKNGNISVSALKKKEIRSKAPVFERDTLVTVPKGPFKVKNSGTGKINDFYQQDNMYLCLGEEGGKGLWGVKFDSPICGRASTVDYFANGKLQIIFASGSKLYLIDRLGRFVSPFPIDLGKEVLIGPDVYDFNGKKKYNVMVLHKDNTVQMYNLQGKKPAEWKGITAKETVKDLPQAVKASGKTWWVVRTSIQTLIYPFYGGEPVTVFEGDRMIRPDSEVVPVKGGVEVTRYDGKKTVVELK